MRSVLQPLALAIACLISPPLIAAEAVKPAAHAAKPVKVLASPDEQKVSQLSAEAASAKN